MNARHKYRSVFIKFDSSYKYHSRWQVTIYRDRKSEKNSPRRFFCTKASKKRLEKLLPIMARTENATFKAHFHTSSVHMISHLRQPVHHPNNRPQTLLEQAEDEPAPEGELFPVL